MTTVRTLAAGLAVAAAMIALATVAVAALIAGPWLAIVVIG